MMKQICIRISGKVQGVWYRKSTKIKADELSVKGTVQNLVNGDVEIYAQGNSANLEALFEWCKIGPKFAVVDSVTIEDLNTTQQFQEFKIIR